MRLEKFNPSDLETLYGIKSKLLNVPKEAVYMGSMLGILSPGESTRTHAHHDNEQFIIIDGVGIFCVGQNKVEVSKGDIIHLQPGESHILMNSNDQTDLFFTSTWWANANGACFSDKERGDIERNTKKLVIISPPATPNGDLHLGHIAGPYLGADILKRYWAQKGEKVAHLTGSDDNQSYVKLKASQIGTTPEDTANSFALEIESVLRDFNILPNHFYRPLSNENYNRFVQDFFSDLYQRGLLEERFVKDPYCTYCHLWLFEATIKGTCPTCHKICGGNICENCGNPNTGSDLEKSICKQCQQPPVHRETKHLMFPLQKYINQLQTFWERCYLPARIRTLLRGLPAKNLPDIPVTRHSEWGITAPFPSFEKYKICSWCEMVPGYLWVVSKLNGQGFSEQRDTWNEEDTEIALFFGFDNTFFYTVLFPALLMSHQPTIKLPSYFIYNEFYLFYEEKFSTSRQHAIWAKDSIRKTSADMLRYYLTATRPEYEKTNFRHSDFVHTIREDLTASLTDWLQNLAQRVTEDFQDICPDGGEWNIEHQEFIESLSSLLHQYEEAFQLPNFYPSFAIRILKELLRRVKKLSVNTQLLRNQSNQNKTSQLEYQTGIVIELTAAKYYALMMYPIMPTFSLRLLHSLGISSPFFGEKGVRLLAKGTSVVNLVKGGFTEM